VVVGDPHEGVRSSSLLSRWAGALGIATDSPPAAPRPTRPPAAPRPTHLRPPATGSCIRRLAGPAYDSAALNAPHGNGSVTAAVSLIRARDL